MKSVAIVLLLSVIELSVAACTFHAGGAMSVAPPAPMPPGKATAPAKPRPDLSGRSRAGIASFYAPKFAGRTMADGNAMDPHGDNAASRTLSLGTTARVTNVQTGQSAVVTVEDRGPYVTGRIMDLSPATAKAIGITQDIGIAKVRVAPIAVALPDGSFRRGAAAAGPFP